MTRTVWMIIVKSSLNPRAEVLLCWPIFSFWFWTFLVLFCFLHNLAKWLSKPQMLLVFPLAMHFSRWPRTHGTPQLGQWLGGCRKLCLRKLFGRVCWGASAWADIVLRLRLSKQGFCLELVFKSDFASHPEFDVYGPIETFPRYNHSFEQLNVFRFRLSWWWRHLWLASFL